MGVICVRLPTFLFVTWKTTFRLLGNGRDARGTFQTHPKGKSLRKVDKHPSKHLPGYWEMSWERPT